MSQIYEWLLSTSFKFRDDSLVFEIGAHNGSDTIELNKVFTNSMFYTYEADPDVYKQNIENMSNNFEEFMFKNYFLDIRNNNKIEVFNLAIADSVKPMQFFKSSGTYCGRENWDYSGSLIKPKNHTKVYPDIKFDKSITVECTTLDMVYKYKKIDKPIAFVWADIQGAELLMIRGGSFNFFDNTRYLYTEIDNNEFYSGNSTLINILSVLPNFEIVFVDGENVLLKNIILNGD